ncbi:MAG: MFS transporter [Janthinobacterium lividum]
MSTRRSIAWFVWGIASIFYAYQYILRVMPNIMLHDIMTQFHIDTALFGQFSGVYYIGYSLMHLPIGIMLDRYGPRYVMTGCILLTVMGMLPLLYAEDWLYPLAGRMLIGVGSSAAILGTFKIIRMMFREQLFTRMLSLSVTIGVIGAIYGGGPLGYMCEVWGYKTVIYIFALIGLILALITYMLVPNIPAASQQPVMSDIKTVFRNKKVIMLCLLAGMMVGPLEGFADVWGSEFLKQFYRFDITTANYLPSIIFMGMCFGGPALSFIAEKTNQYWGAIIGAGTIMFLSFTALVSGLLTISTMTLSFILVGICCAYQILAIYKASTFVPDHVVGLTTAVANMIIMIFGYGFHTAIGLVINAYGNTNIAYAYGIAVIPVTLFLAITGLIIMAYHEKKQIIYDNK